MVALETTEAATPNASSIPRAPTGSWKLSRIEGHKRPRVDPGRATVRYAKQARRNEGKRELLCVAKGTPLACGSFRALSQAEGMDSLCRGSQQHAMTGRSATYCVNVCVVARAPQLLEVCIACYRL